LLYYPFAKETFCDSENPANFFQENHNNFRISADDEVSNSELVQDINLALVVVADLNSPNTATESDEDIDVDLFEEVTAVSNFKK